MLRRVLLLTICLALTSLIFAQHPRPKKGPQAISGKSISVGTPTHKAATRHRSFHRFSTRNRTLKSATTASLQSQIALAAIGQYGLHSTVSLTPSAPEFTAVDPFRNGLTPSNPLKPARPFWYSVDKNGLTIMGLRTETTGALMVGGPPIHVVENQIVGYVPWPDAIAVAQPDGEVPTDPTITEDHAKFAWRSEVGGAWEPVGITVSYPTEEALASNSETPPTYVYVVMKHSGYEWQSTPQADLPAGRDPNVRDKIVPQSDLTKDGSLLVQVDVSQPDYPVDLFPTGPPIGGGLLGHTAGQPAFDPATEGSVYVASMPSMSLPTTPQVPNDLTSFVSMVTLAPGELPAPGEVPAPVTVTVLCGPEHPEVAILAGVPQAWACIAEGGEGPFQWTFTNLPGWLTAHVDPITGQGDGILYGTPTVGTWTFQAHVDDNDTTPPGTGDATITLIVTADPSTEYEYGELEWEVGTPAAVAIEGTGSCELEPTSSTGSMVPAWVDVKQIPGRTINNTALGGPVEHTIGCVVMGTPPISGERYEFYMPNIKFPWPLQNLPVMISGQVAGPYTFDPLPKGVGLSGLAWHEIDKIHDPSTEADLMNRELFGVEPYTGQLYRILPAYAGLEVEGTIVPPPALEGELDEVSAVADPLTAALTASRPDIAAVLVANPNLKLRFGDLVVEANANPDIYVTAGQISDPTGVDPTVIPIGGPLGSPIAIGAMMKVSGTRDLAGDDPTLITWSTQNTIDLPGVQAFLPALDSDLRPALRDRTEPGQVDHGVLWVTGTNTGNVQVVDTAAGKYSQLLAVDTATSLGGASVNPDTQRAYVAGKSLQNVTIFAHGSAPQSAPVIWSVNSISFTVGAAGSFTVMATGSPTRPTLSQTGAPGWVTFVDNGDGTATLAGTPAAGTEGSYPFTITAANTVSPNATQNFMLTVNAGTAPTITSASTTTFFVAFAGSFTVTATGSPRPTLSQTGAPGWVTFVDNGDGTATLAGTASAGTEGSYPFTITAANGVSPDATQDFTLIVASASGAEILTVTRAGTGSGTVTSSPQSINCGATCSAPFTSGTVVTLTATPDPNSTFTGWSGDCSGTAACTVTMNTAHNVTATFAPSSYALQLVINGTGSGSVASSPAGLNCNTDCTVHFPTNMDVTLTATAATGSVFAGWGGACNGAASCVVNMSAARSVTATFNPPPDFSLGLPPGAQTVTAGQPAQFVLTVGGQNGFSGTVSFACTAGIPPQASCSFSPSVVTTGPNPVSTTLTVSTTARGIAALWAPFQLQMRPAFALWLPAIAALLIPITQRKKLPWRHAATVLSLVVLSMALLAGCGGHSAAAPPPGTGGTPAGSYSITVTATSGSTSHTQTVNMIIR